MRRRVVPMMRKQIKSGFDKAMRGDVNDDVALQDFRRAQQAGGQAMLGAQANQMNRQAMAAAGGNPVMTGEFAGAASDLGQKANEATQMAAGQEAAFRNKIRQDNRNNAMADAAKLAEINAQKTGNVIKAVGAAVDLGNSILNPAAPIGKLLKGLYESARGDAPSGAAEEEEQAPAPATGEA